MNYQYLFSILNSSFALCFFFFIKSTIIQGSSFILTLRNSCRYNIFTSKLFFSVATSRNPKKKFSRNSAPYFGGNISVPFSLKHSHKICKTSMITNIWFIPSNPLIFTFEVRGFWGSTVRLLQLIYSSTSREYQVNTFFASILCIQVGFPFTGLPF